MLCNLISAKKNSFFFFNLFMIFVQKYVQDMSNSTRANTRTLPECKKGCTIFLRLHLKALINSIILYPSICNVVYTYSIYMLAGAIIILTPLDTSV